MIYDKPGFDAAIDQGDLIDGCPVLSFKSLHANPTLLENLDVGFRRVLVLTQTCDLANDKAMTANVAEVFDAQVLVDKNMLKPAEIKGPVRGGRVWGWYFLPADVSLQLPEMIVDLRRLHTLRFELLKLQCTSGKRVGRIKPLYREHLAKHFADTFSRIGLPRPYETM